MSEPLTAYLNQFAETETQLLSLPSHLSYDYALVVPIYAEDINCLEPILAKIKDSALLILVTNAPSDRTEATRQFVNDLELRTPCTWRNEHLALLTYAAQKDILLEDMCQQGLPISKNQGVGLARKTGFDIATKLIKQGIISSPWINTTDADVILPADYPFPDSETDTGTAARIYPYKHIAAYPLEEASALYDLSLHYYVAGLGYGNSPYAFHSIGSTLCIHYQYYAKVRGFPKRTAGEDFYMLNKLAKVGRIDCLNSPVLKVQARSSNRTPFGTGQALDKILRLNNPVSDYLYYNPDIFLLLKNWLEIVPEIWPNRNSISLHFLSQNTGKNREILEDCLSRMKILDTIFSGLDQYQSSATFERYLHHWFDAFRTLKFVHTLRDNYLPSVPATEIVNSPFFPDIDKKVRQQVMALI